MLTEEDTTHQVLILGLAGEIFAIKAQQVREILDPIPVTRVPGAKNYLSSILNVRGKVIPLADLRLRFGMPPAPITSDSRFIVIEIEVSGEPTTIGIVADKIYEVTELDTTSLEKAPPIGMRWQPEFVTGISKWKEDFIVVPNLERIFN